MSSRRTFTAQYNHSKKKILGQFAKQDDEATLKEFLEMAHAAK
jgi:hypothetical protein